MLHFNLKFHFHNKIIKEKVKEMNAKEKILLYHIHPTFVYMKVIHVDLSLR